MMFLSAVSLGWDSPQCTALGKPSALELEKKEIDVAAPEVGGVEADGSERGSGSTDAKKRTNERCRAWRLRNSEHLKAYNRQHREQILECKRRHRVNNSETYALMTDSIG